jgi:hypothetical protein
MPKSSNKKQNSTSTIKDLKVSLKNPKSKARIILDVALIVLIVGVISIIFAERSRHNSVYASAEKLKVGLEQESYNASDIQTTCFNPNLSTALGDKKGRKSCRMILAVNSEVNLEDANKLIKTTNEVLEATGEYDTNNQELYPLFDAPRNSYTHGFSIVQKDKGGECGINYEYKGRVDDDPQEVQLLRVWLDCDDTSWFGRSFF